MSNNEGITTPHHPITTMSLPLGNQSQQFGDVALGLLQVALQSLGLLELISLLEVPFLNLLLQLEKLNADSFFPSFSGFPLVRRLAY